jgi:hypothetical protein
MAISSDQAASKRTMEAIEREVEFGWQKWKLIEQEAGAVVA